MASALKRDPVSEVAAGGGWGRPSVHRGSEAGLLPTPCPGALQAGGCPAPRDVRLAPTGICVTQRPRPEVGIRE